MILTDFFVNGNGNLLGFNIKGHSDSGFVGNDIVCAAVSSAAFMTANIITEILKLDANVSVLENGEMFLKIRSNDAPLCRDILSGFKLHMQGLEDQYPKNIHVNYTEV